MANEPIDCSTRLGASSNRDFVLDTTNPAPPRICGSSLNHTAPDKEGENSNSHLKKTTATLSPPLGQFFINMILQIAAFAAAIAFGVFAVKSITIARAANEYSASANSYAARALEEARVANQVAMLAVCSQSDDDIQNSSFAAFCSRVLSGALIVMPDAASNLFTSLSTATRSTATISSRTFIPRNISIITSTATAPEFYSAYSLTTTLSSQSTQAPSMISAPPAHSSARDNQRKTLTIAVSLSFIFAIAVIASVVIVRLRLRSKRTRFAPSSVSKVNGSEEQGEDQRDGDTQGYVEAQKKRNLAGGWWKIFRVYFLDSTVSTIQSRIYSNEKGRPLR